MAFVPEPGLGIRGIDNILLPSSPFYNYYGSWEAQGHGEPYVAIWRHGNRSWAALGSLSDPTHQ